MRCSTLFACLGITCTVFGASAQSPSPGSGTTAAARAHPGRDLGSNLLCASLLAGGALGDVFTVAPIAPRRTGDPDAAIEFGTIWSGTHQATVGAPPADPAGAAAPTGKPATAIVRLPISFSAADRQQFEAAGWRAHPSPDGKNLTYCLDRAKASTEAAANVRGMICVVPLG